MKRRLLSLITAISIICTLMPSFELPVYAAAALTRDSDGNYIINDAADLVEFAKKVNDGEASANGKLMADIVLNDGESWTPIGKSSNKFSGIFDGGNHTISRLYFNDTSKYGIGLFGCIQNAEIKNLNVSGYLAGSYYIGGICGKSENSSITNCSSNCTLAGKNYIGGICGYNNNSINNNTSITNCSNGGNITSTNTDTSSSAYIGGIAGYCRNIKIVRCHNTGGIKANQKYIGGICGASYSYDQVTITDCYNTGEVDGGTADWVGGITGYIPKTNYTVLMQYCYNMGNIKGRTHIGGIVGANYNGNTKVISSYNTGSITSTGIVTSPTIMETSGSLVGGIYGYNYNAGRFYNCYNTGNVSHAEDTYGRYGGIGGYGGPSYSCYYLSSDNVNNDMGGIANRKNDNGAVPKSEEEFASGEVAWLLYNNYNKSITAEYVQVWGQKLGNEPKDKTPVILTEAEKAAKRVYKVTFKTHKTQSDKEYTDYAARYANINGTVTLPEAPASDTKEFVRWSKSDSAEGEEFTANTEITKDITVYAVGKEKYSVAEGGKITTIYGTEITQNLSTYIAYAGGTSAAGKFDYTITSGNDNNYFSINGDNLKVGSTTPAKTYTLNIKAQEKEPEVSLFSTDDAASDVTFTVMVTVEPKSISDATVGAIANQTYTGNAIAPDITVKDGSATLNKSTDYTVAYSNHTNAGQATVTITGKGNYTGTVTTEFTIDKASVNAPTIESKPYTGGTQTAEVETGDKYEITTNEGGTDAGQYDVVLTLADSDNYKWSDGEGAAKTLKFKITQAANEWTKGPAIADVTYGTEPEPQSESKFGTVTVTYAVKGETSYTETKPTNAGSYTARFIVKETGNYTGLSQDVNFSISKGTSSVTEAPAAINPVYNGTEQELVTAGKATGGTIMYSLNKETGYTGTIPTGTNAGSYEVWYKVEGDNGHDGTTPVKIDAAIGAKPISKEMVGDIADQTYTGNAIAPDITVKDGSATLNKSTDYTVAYSNHTNAGQATVTITGTGNYTDTVTTEFTIDKATVTAPTTIASKTYTGETLKADVTENNQYAVTTNNGGIDAGKYDVVLTLKDSKNYKWSDSNDAAKTLKFEITKATNAWKEEPSIADVTYGTELELKGTPKFGTVTVTYTGRGETSYTKGDEKPTNVGDYTAKFSVAGTGNYTALSKDVDFSITKGTSSVDAPHAVENLVYNGTAQKLVTPGMATGGTIKYSFTENDGYTETIPTGTDAKKYEVWYKVEGDNGHDDTKPVKIEVTISAKPISSEMVDSITNQPYTGSVIEPVISVKDGSVTLNKGTDYTVSYSNNTNAGQATVEITGKGNYKDQVTKTFIINKTPVTAPSISSKPYTGGIQTAEVETSDKYEITTNEGGIDAGQYDVVLTLADSDNYKWSDGEGAAKTLKFEITQATNEWTKGPSIADVTYGTEPEPQSESKFGTVTVTYAVKGETSYTETKPTNAGSYTARFIVKETGNYTGLSQDVDFSISKGTSSVTEVPKPNALVYNGTEQELVTAGKATGGTIMYSLNKETGYTETIPTGTNAGSYEVWYKVEGDNGHDGTTPVKIDAAIGAKPISKEMVGDIADQTYTGGTIAPDITVKDGSTTLNKGTDYTVAYSNYTNAGQPTVTITGKGNYTGTVTTEFTIDKASVNAPTIESKPYTGGTQTAEVETSDKYEITTNEGGTDAGEYDVVLTLTDSNNYKWSDSEGAAKTLKFEITQATNEWTETPSIANAAYRTKLEPKGKSKFGEVVVTYAGREGTSYTESTTAPTNAGSYTAKFNVAGTDNYTALSQDVEFNISKVDLSVDALPVAKNLVYNCKAQELVTPGTTTGGIIKYSFTENGNYTETIPTGTNAGSYSVWCKIEGDNDHDDTGPIKIDVTISAKSINSATVESITNQIYTGSVIEPAITIKDGSVTLNKNTDYTISYSGNINVGKAKIAITGKGNYNETKTVEFDIVKSGSQTEVTGSTITYGDNLTLTANVSKQPAQNNVSLLRVEADEVGFYVVKDGQDISLGTAKIDYGKSNSDSGTSTLILDTAQKQLEPGANTIKAVYGGSINLNGSNSNTISVTLNKKPITLVWTGSDTRIYDGNASNVTASSTDIIKGDNIIINVTGGMETNAGTHTAATVLTGDDAAYYTITRNTKEYVISKAEPTYTMPTELRIRIGHTLEDVKLPTGWAWKDNTISVDNVKINQFAAIFTPSDTTNYNTVEVTLPVKIIVPSPSSGPKFTITFNANNGGKNITSTVLMNEEVKEPASPIKEGYIFDGWYRDSKFSEPYDFSTKVTQSFTLYAKWTEASVSEPAQKPDVTPDPPIEPSVQETNPFGDVHSKDWFYDDIVSAYKNGLMFGVNDTEFKPYMDITRAMFVTILYRLENEPQTTNVNTFTDVPKNGYYANAVSWANENGIVKGYSDTNFEPNRSITREQMATIIYRYAKFKGQKTASTGTLTYTDSMEVSDYAKDAVIWSKINGILYGNNDNSFAPKANTIRAQAAAVFMRIAEKLNKQTK